MKVILATSKGQVNHPKEIFTCNELEIVRFGLLQTRNNTTGLENSMFGITTNGKTTTVLVKNLDINRDFYFELIKNSIQEEFKVVVDENGKFTVNLHSKFRFNLNEIVDSLIETAKELDEGKVFRISGRYLIPIVDLDKKEQKRLNKKSS